MTEFGLRLTRFHRVGATVHAVALSGDGEHLLVGTEHGLHLVDRRGYLRCRLGRRGGAFSAVALSQGLDSGLAMERAGRLLRLGFERGPEEEQGERLQIAAVTIWEQRDDLYSLVFAPGAGTGDTGLIALGHHARGLTALDGRGQLLWRLGPQEGMVATGRTWHAAISPDGTTLYAAALGGASMRQGKIVAIDATLGKPVNSVSLSGRVALLASLPAPLGVAAALHRAEPAGECCQLVGLDADLRNRVWSLPCPPGVTITALAAAPRRPVVVAGTNTGELWQVGAFTGRIHARYDLLFASTVLSVAIAETGEIAAGLANGQVAFLERVRDEKQHAI